MSGRYHNLTEAQFATLKELYVGLFEYIDHLPSQPSTPSAISSPTSELSPKDKPNTEKSPSLGFLGLRKMPKLMGTKETEEPSPASPEVQLNSSEFRSTLFGVNQFDHPDELMLRFLRARKWDVKESLKMLVKSIQWFHLHDIARLKRVGETEVNMSLIKKGECYFQGFDREGRPVCHINIRLHDPKALTIEEVQSFALLNMETSRLLFVDKVDTVAVLFNLTDFTMANMDYAAVKFLINVLEKDYPESLGRILILNANWVFSGVWKIISAMLDPVVVEKVKFITLKELTDYIEPSQLPENLGGTMKQKMTYLPPSQEENIKMTDSEGRFAAETAFNKTVVTFEEETRKWVSSASVALSPGRDEAAKDLRAAYAKLDPFIRARTIYHRLGVIQGPNDVDWSRMKA
ncbi:phosphatidylinositol transfer protein csr1 [Entomophthora muscae]|uniref:Phosphatidylinositol transfer protein csr1 n=1 Tax=Entomophthora muscae TaxID=34485 RepID=A0ACC2RQQ1_9FUNG|nr:phosphatidylinositol transfer protein csr1 [Entomophthora muscae]